MPEYYKRATDDGDGYQYAYDSAGRLVEALHPEGYVEAAYAYGLNGELLTETDALGQITYYDYDVRGNLVEVFKPSKKQNQEQDKEQEQEKEQERQREFSTRGPNLLMMPIKIEPRKTDWEVIGT